MNRLMSVFFFIALSLLGGQVFAGWESWRSFQDTKGGGVNVRTTNPGSHAEMVLRETEIRARFNEMARLLTQAGFQEIDSKEIGGRDFSSGKKLGHDCQITLEYLYDHAAKKYNAGNSIHCSDGKTEIVLPAQNSKEGVRKVFDRFMEVYRAAPK